MSELSDRVASQLQKHGEAQITQGRATLGELYDAIEVLGLSDPRSVLIEIGEYGETLNVTVPHE